MPYVNADEPQDVRDPYLMPVLDRERIGALLDEVFSLPAGDFLVFEGHFLHFTRSLAKQAEEGQES